MIRKALISIVLSSLIISTFNQNQSMQTLQCNNQSCPVGAGQCDQANNCICLSPFYTLINENSPATQYCNYKQVSRWIPFSIEILLPSGGFFYIGRTYRAAIKLFVLLLPIIFSLIGYCFYDVKNPNKCWEVFTLTSFVVIFPLFLIDHVVDLSLFGIGYYSDGYGVPLL